MKAERATHDLYVNEPQRILQYSNWPHHPTEISQLSISHLRAWPHHGQERGLSPYTIQGQALTLKTFFRFAYEEGYLETNIATRLNVPRAPRKIIQTFSEEQLRQLLASAKSRRDKAILGLFIDTGLIRVHG